jgi:hypothetical protein
MDHPGRGQAPPRESCRFSGPVGPHEPELSNKNNQKDPVVMPGLQWPAFVCLNSCNVYVPIQAIQQIECVRSTVQCIS